MSEQLSKRLTVTEIVRVYEEAVRDIRGSYAQLSATHQRLNNTFVLDGSGRIYFKIRGQYADFDDPSDMLLSLRHEVWGYVVDRLEIRRAMSNRRWEELQRQIRDRQMPEVTEENVWAMVRSFESRFNEMLGEAVEEVFNRLRPRGSRYKTNSEMEVPEKVILGWMVERAAFGRSRWRVSYHCSQELIALENVFNALDGNGMISKTPYSAIQNVIDSEGFDGVGETDLFRFKCFANRNLHLWFKRLDLLSRFNAIAGGRRLRAAETAAE